MTWGARGGLAAEPLYTPLGTLKKVGPLLFSLLILATMNSRRHQRRQSYLYDVIQLLFNTPVSAPLSAAPIELPLEDLSHLRHRRSESSSSTASSVSSSASPLATPMPNSMLPYHHQVHPASGQADAMMSPVDSLDESRFGIQAPKPALLPYDL